MPKFDRNKPKPRKGNPKSRFGKKQGKRRSDDDAEGKKDRRDLPLVKAVCDSCHRPCEVPFKPTKGKPVYCSDCFGSETKGEVKSQRDKDLDQINKKLDRIMKALQIK